jgi:hypothetical protein
VSGIEADIVAEARRLLARAQEERVPVRLLGGVAIRLHAEVLPEALCRVCADLDFVGARGTSAGLERLFRDAGYEPHVAFNALNGKERLLFFDRDHDRQVDVFVGAFRMCHAVPVADRLHVEPATLPLAELLLTKLQVVELNEKDVRDALAIVHAHPVAEHDVEAVNASVVASLCAQDWGLWRTVTANLAECRSRVGEYDLSAPERERLAERIDALLQAIERAPKSRAWRLRARIGERKRWYDLPEEVAGGP